MEGHQFPVAFKIPILALDIILSEEELCAVIGNMRRTGLPITTLHSWHHLLPGQKEAGMGRTPV